MFLPSILFYNIAHSLVVSMLLYFLILLTLPAATHQDADDIRELKLLIMTSVNLTNTLLGVVTMQVSS